MTADHPTREERYAAVLHAMAVEDNPGHADWDDCATTGPCREEGQRFADLVAADPAPAQPDAALSEEVERLRRWKAEALPVMAGLQEVGHALGLPLGASITGRDAVDAALDLRALAARAAQPVPAPLDPEVERGALCFHGTERACLSIRCGSDCGMVRNRFDRMHPCPACLVATIHDLRAALTAAGIDPYSLRPVVAPGGEYEAGESSGYADWVGALGEVVPADVELLPSAVAEYVARTQAKVARVEAIYAAWMAWDGSRGPDGQMHPDSSSPHDRERLRAALSGEDQL